MKQKYESIRYDTDINKINDKAMLAKEYLAASIFMTMRTKIQYMNQHIKKDDNDN